jgi:hypothetical protein
MAIANLAAYDEFVEFITSSPTLEQIADFRLSAEVEDRISDLLEMNRNAHLSPEESVELDEYMRLEHIMRKAKIRAFEKLDQQTS